MSNRKFRKPYMDNTYELIGKNDAGVNFLSDGLLTFTHSDQELSEEWTEIKPKEFTSLYLQGAVARCEVWNSDYLMDIFDKDQFRIRMRSAWYNRQGIIDQNITFTFDKGETWKTLEEIEREL